MTKILFIQGIHNFSFKEGFITDVSEATGYPVVHFPFDYGLFESEKQLELIREVNTCLERSDDRFIVLAHSFGGVLAYCLSDKAYEKVDRIVTLASPHTTPFGWFKRTVGKLPYRATVPVAVQDSCGFFFDLTVPFFYTRFPNGRRHTNFLGTHTKVPDRRTFYRRLITESA